jgi:hypothetical protein
VLCRLPCWQPYLVEGDELLKIEDISVGRVSDKYDLSLKPGKIMEFEVQFYGAHFPENEETFKFCGFTHTITFTRK